jgi:hypothetical protein
MLLRIRGWRLSRRWLLRRWLFRKSLQRQLVEDLLDRPIEEIEESLLAGGNG